MTAMIRIMILGLLAVTMLCTSCGGGGTAASLSASDLLAPSPVADEDISSGMEFDSSSGTDHDNTGSAVSR